jgi:hypothetical protein
MSLCAIGRHSIAAVRRLYKIVGVIGATMVPQKPPGLALGGTLKALELSSIAPQATPRTTPGNRRLQIVQ